jgi:hypothetical protein
VCVRAQAFVREGLRPVFDPWILSYKTENSKYRQSINALSTLDIELYMRARTCGRNEDSDLA